MVREARFRKIQKGTRKTPHGRQSVKQLMKQGEATNSLPVEAPREFERVARPLLPVHLGRGPLRGQGSPVRHFLIGGHLLPDGHFRHGEYPVFVGNVLDPVIVLLKGMSPLDIQERKKEVAREER